jgi:hypothetical protein
MDLRDGREVPDGALDFCGEHVIYDQHLIRKTGLPCTDCTAA